MSLTTYEIHTLCDNCGLVAGRERVDEAMFFTLVQQSDPGVGEQDDEESSLADEGDLISEEQDLPVEVFVQHVPVCSHCQESP
jgi:hypothetical protein